MPRLSFIIPVKNAASFIREAVAAIRAQELSDWELIVVDDHSEDSTAALVADLASSDVRIRLVTNHGRGQVAALNTGYPLTSGEFIKFADGDDLLSPDLSAYIPDLTAVEAAYHDIEIVREDLSPINILRLGSSFRDESPVSFFRPGVVHPPRSSWMFSRSVGDKLFPLPEALASPHEDYWIALVLKKRARTMAYVPRPLYLYRQHSGQTFGGIYNFEADVVKRRGEAMLRVLDVIARSGGFLIDGEPGIDGRLAAMGIYYGLLAADRPSCPAIFRSGLSLSQIVKLALIKKTPRLASLISRFKSKRTAGVLKKLK